MLHSTWLAERRELLEAWTDEARNTGGRGGGAHYGRKESQSARGAGTRCQNESGSPAGAWPEAFRGVESTQQPAWCGPVPGGPLSAGTNRDLDNRLQ